MQISENLIECKSREIWPITQKTINEADEKRREKLQESQKSLYENSPTLYNELHFEKLPRRRVNAGFRTAYLIFPAFL